jgi:1-acyl-sn-glycerol-3-phosphate acyltransferase
MRRKYSKKKKIAYWIGKIWLWLFGWQLVGETEFPQKFVLIAAPHTSNWDLSFMLASSYVLLIRVRWLGKHTLFTGLKGRSLRALGGLAVDRCSSHNLVEQIAGVFNNSENLILAVPPEGTRGKADYWKSGFYHIARAANVPIAYSFLDYNRRRCGIGGFLTPTGDLHADMEFLREFYKEVQGKFPENVCEPRLREESETGEFERPAARNSAEQNPTQYK